MLPNERKTLEATRALIAAHKERFDQRRIRLPGPAGEPPAGCVASFVVAASDRGVKLFDGALHPALVIPTHRQHGDGPKECAGSVVLAASYALGHQIRPRLLYTEWPEYWFKTAGIRGAEAAAHRERIASADEAIAVLDAVLDGKLDEALEGHWRHDPRQDPARNARCP